jgi:Ca-activated chloride channel family protein
MRCSNHGRARKVIRTWARLLLLAAGTGPLLAQSALPNADSTGLQFSVDVKLVVLNASARDRRGGAVPQLQARNFQLKENGQLQTIRLQAAKDVPVAVGLVIDGSKSMQSKLPEVAAAAVAFAHASDPRDEVFIVNFNEQVHFSFPDTKLLGISPAALAGALLRPSAIGQTALYDAIADALKHIRTSPIERKVLLVISDGGDNASKTTRRELLQNIARSAVEIYTIGLLDEDDSDANSRVLRRIAESSGGQAFRPKPGNAVRICERIAEDIRTQYVISYSPVNQRFCGEYRAIELRATSESGAKLAVRTRAGYIAQPSGPSEERK